VRTLLVFGCAVVLSACPAPSPEPDASVLDAGPEPVSCDSPEDCVAFGGVCRREVCAADVPCSDDLECGLGERCVGRQCRFRGCTKNDDCPTHFCDVTTFACAECAADPDCPVERPVCDTQLRQCVQCSSDADCAPPGPAHCSRGGQCVGCLTDEHCPNGLGCSSGLFCVGAPSGSPCPMGLSCGAGLVCVNLNNNPVCLPGCNLYQPECGSGEICFGLTYATTTSLVFESMGPIGVCFSPQQGLRNAREPCQRGPNGSNCQPNLQCVPETASLALCRPYCNPFASGTCPVGEQCTSFVGDYSGREFGVCLPDTGFGAKCLSGGDSACRAGLSCQPYDDPSDFDEVGAVCQFNVGDAGFGAPCAPRALADGGVLLADRGCKSGKCVSDPLALSPVTAPYFCFGACASDGDCGDAGVCDADFTLSTAYGSTGAVRGCRPKCEAESQCAGYDAGVTCKVRVQASASTPQFTTTCSPSAGALGSGESCTINGQCRSGWCVMDDARGVRRGGVCSAPCVDGSNCAGDGGTMPLRCQPSVFLVHRGPDGVAPSVDDRLAVRNFCTGAPCTSDADCGPGVCAAVPSAADVQSALVLRCAAATTGLLRGGEACVQDAQCQSGACGTLQAPSTGSGKACFEACTATTTCGAGMSCRAGGLQLATARGVVAIDSCAP
jgi:hypothetical protein